MSGVTAVQQGDVHGAIARASAATGVEFEYLLAQARIESGLDADARAGSSSAAGLFQFIDATWLETLDRFGSRHGLGWADAAISNNGSRAKVDDPSARAQIMALRFDPEVSSLMAAELARDNAAQLGGFLGRPAQPAELYLAHFLGLAGARSFLGTLERSPASPAAAHFPKPAAANRAIFFDGDRPRSMAEVMELVESKVTAAMHGGNAAWPGQGTMARQTQPLTAISRTPTDLPVQPGKTRRPSMAETLRSTFGTSDRTASGAAQRIGEAYGKFRAFGL